MLLLSIGAKRGFWLQEPGQTCLVKFDAGENLQLLVQVLAVCAHILAEFKAALDVGCVDEVVHVQYPYPLLRAAPRRRCWPAGSALLQHCHVNLEELQAATTLLQTNSSQEDRRCSTASESKQSNVAEGTEPLDWVKAHGAIVTPLQAMRCRRPS